jgi:integrase
VQRLSTLKPAAARNWLKALRGLLEFAVAEGFRGDNPALNIKPRKHKSQSHHAWTAEEMAQFEAFYPIGTKPRLAFALLRYTMQRRGDVILLGRQHIRRGEPIVVGADIIEHYLEFKQQKTGNEMYLPILPELMQVIEATPGDHLTFLVTKNGGSFSGSDFSEMFRTWCDRAGLPKHCTAHGLRHAGASNLANNLATTHLIASFTGHKSLSQVQRYTAAYDRRRLAQQAVVLMTKGGTRGG